VRFGVANKEVKEQGGKGKTSCCSGIIVMWTVTVHQNIREKKKEPFFAVQQLCEQWYEQ
jgi:hypothetical protein